MRDMSVRDFGWDREPTVSGLFMQDIGWSNLKGNLRHEATVAINAAWRVLPLVSRAERAACRAVLGDAEVSTYVATRFLRRCRYHLRDARELYEVRAAASCYHALLAALAANRPEAVAQVEGTMRDVWKDAWFDGNHALSALFAAGWSGVSAKRAADDLFWREHPVVLDAIHDDIRFLVPDAVFVDRSGWPNLEESP